jgi:[protein-PII] uridylyltransferase
LEATRLVREFISLVDDPFRSSKEAKQSFLNILKGDHGARALDQAFETGFLDAFIPEFGRVRDRVQFDTYHIFPVGRHCLETVKHLKGLRRQHEIMLLDVFSELKRPESVLLAALFHDIGKVGRDHARRGVTITREILKRLAYPEERAEDILFLIRHHLLLVETATRRDLNDEKVVVQCARTIEDAERLKMLYLLTWADARATGPRAWSEWTANLVQELFFKLLHILKGNELATRQASSKVEQTQSEVRRFVQGRMDTAALEQAFEMMSPRYLLHVGAPDISDHLGLVLRLREKVDRKTPFAFVLEAKKLEWEGCWELTFVAEDRPGLFSDLAGVLALNNINILSAQIFTWRDRTAVDIFRVSDPPDPMHAREIWDRVEKNLEDTFKGKLSLSYRLERKAEPSLMSVPKVSTRPPEVEVDNSSSDFFTLVEVFADDRVGLLHLITRTLFELKLDIRIAKIATKVDQVADIFYVRDLEGQKVEDPEQVQEIKRALQYQLTRGPGTAS